MTEAPYPQTIEDLRTTIRSKCPPFHCNRTFNNPLCVLVIGESRAGKGTLINNFCKVLTNTLADAVPTSASIGTRDTIFFHKAQRLMHGDVNPKTKLVFFDTIGITEEVSKDYVPVIQKCLRGKFDCKKSMELTTYRKGVRYFEWLEDRIDCVVLVSSYVLPLPRALIDTYCALAKQNGLSLFVVFAMLV